MAAHQPYLQALIYPGLGLGAILAEAKMMTDGMIAAGAKRLSNMAPALKDPTDALLPAFEGESVRLTRMVAHIRCRECQLRGCIGGTRQGC